MVGIRFGGGRDELLTFMQYLGVITPPLLISMVGIRFGGGPDEILTSCIITPPYTDFD